MAKKNQTQIDATAGKQEILITRDLEAPRELVFKAYTDPSLYRRWLGPREITMTLELFEPHAGGRWRYIHEDPEGKKFTFHGVFHEVTFPVRIIDTFEFEGLPEKGHVVLESVTFEALPDDRTRLVSHAVYQSVLDRDGQLQSGMERGIRDSFDRLEELLAEIQG